MSINDYKPRVIDQLLSRKLRGKGAVLIEGAKWCGKTSTGEQQAKSVIYMSDSARRDQYRIFVDSTPKVILDGETPRLIDEWQQTPKLWDMVRFEVDHRHGMGQFILTGSAVPAKLEELHHTGTGRIARLLMRPMSLWESGDSNGTISLKELFTSPKSIAAENNNDLQRISYLICRGGWPQAAVSTSNLGSTVRFDGFIEFASIGLVSVASPLGIYYVKSAKRFAAKYSGGYANNWPGAEKYMNDTRTAILTDKSYIYGGKLYVWDNIQEDLLIV